MTRRAARRLGASAALLWLLAGPPIEDGVPNPDAPREVWRQFGVFRSEAECLRAKELMRKMTGDGKYGWEPVYWQTMVHCTPTG